MPTKQELYEALRKADAAGDTTAAKRFADRIKNYDESGESQARSNREQALADRQDRQQERFKVDDGGGVGEFFQNFGRGAERIVSGDVSGQEYADLAEGAVRSLTAPIGGDYVAAGGAEIMDFIRGEQGGPSQLSQQRARREELAQEAPVTSGASEALGFGGLTVPLKAAFSRLPQTVQRALRAAPTSGNVGQRTRNAARAAGEGVAVGGAGEYLKTGDPGRAAATAAISGVATPAASGALRFAGDRAMDVPRYAKALVGSPADSSLSAIAKRVDMPLDDVRAAYNNYLEVNGRPPALAEISDPRTIKRFKRMAQDTPSASDTLDEAEVRIGQERPEQMRALVEQGRTSPSPKVIRDTASDELTQTLRGARTPEGDTLADTVISGDQRNAAAELLASPEVYRDLSRNMRSRIGPFIEDPANNNLTLGDLIDIRTSAAKRIGPGEAYRFQEFVDELDPILEGASDEYAAAFDRYRQLQQFADGVEGGRGVMSADTEDVVQGVPRMDPPARAGQKAGARGAVARRAGDTGASAIRTARDLQEPGLQRRLSTSLGSDEAERLRRVGETQTRSAENLRNLSPRVAEPDELSDATAGAAEAAAMLMGRYGPQGLAVFVSGLVRRLQQIGVPPGVARRTAENITNAQMTDDIITRLEQTGVRRSDVQRALQDSVSAMSATLSTGEGSAPIDDGEFELQSEGTDR